MSRSTPSAGARRTLGAGATLVLFILVYAVLYGGVHFLQSVIEARLPLGGVRSKAAFTLSMSVLLLWAAFGLMRAFLGLRGQTFADIGWGKPAPVSGWLSGAALAVFYVGLMFAGPLRGAPGLTDWSAFRLASALGAGLTAGICEEAIFRGFVMTQAREAGAPVVCQILIAALLFGLAHVGWGGLTAHFSPAAFAGSAATTFLIGLLFAGIYVLSRRSLTPTIFAHAAIDLAIEPWLLLYAIGGGFSHFGH